MKIWSMNFLCCITKATNTHSEYVIFLAFPLQQWLRESAITLRNTYVACLVFFFPPVFRLSDAVRAGIPLGSHEKRFPCFVQLLRVDDGHEEI